MKLILTIFIFSSLFIGCNKDSENFKPWTEDACVQHFMKKNKLYFAPYDQRGCNFYAIYNYEGSYYFVPSCCLCDMVGTILSCTNKIYALNLEGSVSKYEDFFETAVRTEVVAK